MKKRFFYEYSERDDLVAIRTTSKVISYKELYNTAKEIFRKSVPLKAPNKYVPILISNSIEFIVLVIALWENGLVPVPLNIKWTEKEIETVIRKYGFEICLCEKISYDKVKNLDIEIVLFEQLNSIAVENFENLRNDEAVVIFTSGSTGFPKGVVHTFTSLRNSIVNGSEILNLCEGDRWLASLPFYHIGGFQIISRALSNGCEIIIPDSLETDYLLDVIEKFNPTHISLVSTQLQRLVEKNCKVSDSVKLTLIGGGFIDDELILKAAEFGWRPLRVYGSSETASFVTAASISDIRKYPKTVGKPIKNVKIKISEDGEILISSNSLFKYYLQNQKETNEKLKGNYYHSGDLGYIEDVYLFIEARRNDLIVTGGENVNPYEVEQALKKITGIKEVCVLGIEDAQWGHKVCAAITTSKPISLEEIKTAMRNELSAFKIPKEIIILDELPKTSLGKLDRNKLKEIIMSKI
jgi:O-succinylbenzoic acid--CoA ligase